MKIANHKKGITFTALGILTAINLVGFAYALNVPVANSGTITVTAEPPFVAQTASIGGVNCPISANVINCPNSTISGGSTSALLINVKNTAAVTQAIPAPTITYASSQGNSSIYLTTTPTASYPMNVGAGLSVTLQFNIQASTINQGTDYFVLVP